jgi:hypothetical protein
MHAKGTGEQFTRGSSKVWTILGDVAYAGWGSTARLAMLMMVKQSPIDVLVLIIMRH